MKWVRCVLDHGWHAVDERRDHLPGVFEALCGHLLPMVALHDEPSGRLCEACAARQLACALIRCHDDQISGRPPVETLSVNPLSTQRVRGRGFGWPGGLPRRRGRPWSGSARGSPTSRGQSGLGLPPPALLGEQVSVVVGHLPVHTRSVSETVWSSRILASGRQGRAWSISASCARVWSSCSCTTDVSIPTAATGCQAGCSSRSVPDRGG